MLNNSANGLSKIKRRRRKTVVNTQDFFCAVPLKTAAFFISN
jgi:hypothetical protein